ncbi:MAG: NAD-dependent epimerase/dehydratase family protein, partial [Nitrosopumilaceae archaeon]|nr:NAD-dependent epimerase/dehydratase family protein [Nitrosopumilaceae archaeon]NIX63010.1 NAD-dependent epimerase/dehydratase family protein [Nitrosopumilaceae archaeon]
MGASGFIGRWVAHYLNQIGAKLHLPVRDYESAKQTFFDYQISGEVSELDLMEFSTVEKFFEEVKPSITFNLCGYGVDRSERDPQIAERINQDLIGHLGKGLKKTSDRSWTGLNLVHVGTALEYGAINGNLSENSLSHPTT